MIYVPKPKPFFESAESVYTEINYDKRFTYVDDVTRDGEHIHDFYEIYINLSGDVSFLVEDNVYKINSGDIIVSKPNEIHRCIYHSNCMHEHFCIWIRELAPITDRLKKQFEKNKLLSLPEEDKQKVISACFSFYKSRSGSGENVFAEIKSFFEILDVICLDHHDTAEAQSLPSSFSDIVEYISEHYAEPTCTVASLCNIFFISKSTLCRRFRSYFQTTPSDYIEAKRFAEAKKLLGAGQPVQNACLSSGFSDCSYFIKCFRKKFGITPYKYQQQIL